MTSILERNRKRLIAAKMAEVSARGNMEPVRLPDGSVTTLELDSEILKKALIKMFETPAFANASLDDAEIAIRSHYSCCLTRSYEKLTTIGSQFISGLLENLIEQAFYQRVDK
ncbi:UNVERIFIED_ORG: hypothetical protein FHW05_002343 [Pantoea agglomerans]